MLRLLANALNGGRQRGLDQRKADQSFIGPQRFNVGLQPSLCFEQGVNPLLGLHPRAETSWSLQGPCRDEEVTPFKFPTLGEDMSARFGGTGLSKHAVSMTLVAMFTSNFSSPS